MSIARFKVLSARRRRADAELDETIETTVADTADGPEVTLEKKNQSDLVLRTDQAVSRTSGGYRSRLLSRAVG